MTNDKIRMTKECLMTKYESAGLIRLWKLVILFVISASSFVIVSPLRAAELKLPPIRECRSME
jgi:hypothetical protein